MNLPEYSNQAQHQLIVENYAEQNSISFEDAKKIISEMSFKEYHYLTEVGANITPPSGQTISPSATKANTGTSTNTSQIKSIWPGSGAPIEVGMTVGLKDKTGKPIPGTVSQVDSSAKGVKVKNPTTGQDEWVNTDTLEPFMASTGDEHVLDQPDNLQRLRELAGIAENCSAGASGAGAIAIAPTGLGKMQKRQQTDERLKKEYVRDEPARSIVGDTKPSQASGELSATLAANGKKTASRINNGQRR